MVISSPIPFREAMQLHAVRQVMPTSLSSRELGQLNQAILQRSITSARTTLEGYLDEVKSQLETFLNPTTQLRPDGTPYTAGTDMATMRLELKQTLQRLGYQPDPDKRGTIEDLSSDQRINLVTKTNAEVEQGFGHWLAGQDEAVLDQWPAQELVREEARKQERDWMNRFRTAGESTGDPIGKGWTITPEGRLVALKNHPIWAALGSQSLFEDGLGNPWPPFAFSSGMGVRDVDRDDAMAMGLIDRDTRVEARSFEFGSDL